MSQAVPSLEVSIAVGAGEALRFQVDGLDVRFNVVLPVGGPAAKVTDPAQSGIPVHVGRYHVVKTLTWTGNDMSIIKS